MLTVRGGGVSHLGPNRRHMWKFWSFFLIEIRLLDTQNTFYLIVKGLKYAFFIWKGRPLANDYSEGAASCKWSSGGAGLLQMIIWRAAAVRGEIGDFKIHELSFVFSGRSTRWARKASSSMSGHMLNPRSTMWRSPSLRWRAVYAQDLHWGDILPVFPVTQGRELSWEDYPQKCLPQNCLPVGKSEVGIIIITNYQKCLP